MTFFKSDERDSDHPKTQPTRRRFLEVASAATAGVFAGAKQVEAKERRSRRLPSGRSRRTKTKTPAKPPAPKNDIRTVNLGAIPTLDSLGSVVVPKEQLVFLTFNAAKLDPQGNFVENGTAIFELTGCKEWRYRVPGDHEQREKCLNIDSLLECQTYEVRQSSWIEELGEQASRWEKRQLSKLRHFVVTFFGEFGPSSGATHIEFLAEKIDVQVVDAPVYEEVLVYMDFMDAAA